VVSTTLKRTSAESLTQGQRRYLASLTYIFVQVPITVPLRVGFGQPDTKEAELRVNHLPPSISRSVCSRHGVINVTCGMRRAFERYRCRSGINDPQPVSALPARPACATSSRLQPWVIVDLPVGQPSCACRTMPQQRSQWRPIRQATLQVTALDTTISQLRRLHRVSKRASCSVLQ